MTVAGDGDPLVLLLDPVTGRRPSEQEPAPDAWDTRETPVVSQERHVEMFGQRNIGSVVRRGVGRELNDSGQERAYRPRLHPGIGESLHRDQKGGVGQPAAEPCASEGADLLDREVLGGEPVPVRCRMISEGGLELPMNRPVKAEASMTSVILAAAPESIR